MMITIHQYGKLAITENNFLSISSDIFRKIFSPIFRLHRVRLLDDLEINRQTSKQCKINFNTQLKESRTHFLTKTKIIYCYF